MKEYLEDYFGLRRWERYGLGLIILLGVVLLIVRVSVQTLDLNDQQDLEKFSEIINSDKGSITEKDYLDDHDSALKLEPFNPNTVRKEALFRMGLPPSAVKSIINYRAAGFVYRQPEDLLKCYGVDALLFDLIAPYVVLVEKQKNTFSDQTVENNTGDQLIVPFAFDPNTVTRKELENMNLPKRFIDGFLNFRGSGAKFYSMRDFEKIYSLTKELKSILKPYVQFPELPQRALSSKREVPVTTVRQRFQFDPNQISRDSLLLLGVSPSVASIWVKYRASGKIYYNTQDLGNIYGLTPEKISELSGLMTFPNRSVVATKKPLPYIQASLNIDPNKASLEDLVEIKGVGRYYANQILWYREQLGGYYAINQIAESKNLPDSTFNAIKYHFIEPSLDSLRKINVNTTRRRGFADHPYISYDRVNRIITHREFVGRIENMEYLLKLGLLSKQEARLLEPYLSFEQKD